MPDTSTATALLEAWGRGDQAAFNEVMPLVHTELKGLARRYPGRERVGHGLQPVIDPRKSRVVEMRFFGGLSIEETADVLQVSGDTVGRDLEAREGLPAARAAWEP